MENEKCIVCGSLGGFHFDNCPKAAGNEIVVFEHEGQLSLGTLENVLPEDWSARFARKEGGHYNYCFGMKYKEFSKKFHPNEIAKMINDTSLPREYFVYFMTRFLIHNIHNEQ